MKYNQEEAQNIVNEAHSFSNVGKRRHDHCACVMQDIPRCTVYISIPYFKTVLGLVPILYIGIQSTHLKSVIEECSSHCGSIRSSSVATQHLGRGHHHPRAFSLLTSCGDHVWSKRQTTDQVKKLYCMIHIV